MSGLVHISKYLNEFKVELDAYDKKLTERAEEVSVGVKEITAKLKELNVEPFGYFWDYEEDGLHFNPGMTWDGSKVLFIFDDPHDAEVVLGSNRDIRVAMIDHLEDFLKAGLNSIRAKTKKLN